MVDLMLDKNKRTIIKSSFALIFIKSLLSYSLFSKENFSYLFKGPLAGNIYYTKHKPGRWSKLINSHVPILNVHSNTLEVSTPHEMKGYDHFIIKHIILDNKLNFISEKIFDPSKDFPISKHNISGYDHELYALSICNKHDAWLNMIKI